MSPRTLLRWIALLLLGLGSLEMWAMWPHESPKPDCGCEGLLTVFGGLFVACQSAVAVGIWRASIWAKWTCGLGGLLTSFWFFKTVREFDDPWKALWTWPGFVPNVLIAVLMAILACVAIYCLLPTSGRHFAEARRERRGEQPTSD
jgi:hypothetical protein